MYRNAKIENLRRAILICDAQLILLNSWKKQLYGKEIKEERIKMQNEIKKRIKEKEEINGSRNNKDVG